jgi:hypothetical protein
MLRRRSHNKPADADVSVTGEMAQPRERSSGTAGPDTETQEGLRAQEEFREELLEDARAELKANPKPLEPSFGFTPGGERSSAAPTGKPGAPIVGAARGLRERRHGTVSINGTEPTDRAKKLIARSKALRAEAARASSSAKRPAA